MPLREGVEKNLVVAGMSVNYCPPPPEPPPPYGKKDGRKQYHLKGEKIEIT